MVSVLAGSVAIRDMPTCAPPRRSARVAARRQAGFEFSFDTAHSILEQLALSGDLKSMACASAVCRDWRHVAACHISSMDEQRLAHMLKTQMPQFIDVRVMVGPYQGAIGMTAERYDASGNAPSSAYIQAGVLNAHALSEFNHGGFTVVQLLNGKAIVLALHQIQIINSEVFDLIKRATRRPPLTVSLFESGMIDCIPDRVACTALGECLTEGKGGLRQCLCEGPYFIGIAAAYQHPYAWNWDKYTRTGGVNGPYANLEVPPRFATLGAAVEYFEARNIWPNGTHWRSGTWDTDSNSDSEDES